MSDYSINRSHKSPASTLPRSPTLPIPFHAPKDMVHVKPGFPPISPQTALTVLASQEDLNDTVHTITFGLISTVYNHEVLYGLTIAKLMRTATTSVIRSANLSLTSRTRGTMLRCWKGFNQMQATLRPKFPLAMVIETPSGSDIVIMDKSSCWLGRATIRNPSPPIYISHQTTPQMLLTQYPPGSTISSWAQPSPFTHSAKQWQTKSVGTLLQRLNAIVDSMTSAIT